MRLNLYVVVLGNDLKVEDTCQKSI